MKGQLAEHTVLIDAVLVRIDTFDWHCTWSVELQFVCCVMSWGCCLCPADEQVAWFICERGDGIDVRHQQGNSWLPATLWHRWTALPWPCLAASMCGRLSGWITCDQCR